MTDDARQDGAGPHVASGQTDADKQKCSPRPGCADPHIRGHRKNRTGAGTDAVNGGDDWLRAMAHRLDHGAGHRREFTQARHVFAGQGFDDLEDVTAGTEVTPCPRDHNRPHLPVLMEALENIPQLCVRVEGQRILPLGPVQGDGCDLSGYLPQEMPCLVIPHAGHSLFSPFFNPLVVERVLELAQSAVESLDLFRVQ